jgi:hypothetical protein
VLVLGVAFALVFGIGQLLGGGTDETGPSAQPASVSTPAGDGASATATSAAPTARATTAVPSGKARTKKVREPLAMPTGPCPDNDVRVVPVVKDAYAGSDVRLGMELTTFDSPACTWEVSSDSLALKLTSGSDRIWTSQECPATVPTESVVLRKTQAVVVDVVWNGRRSDPDCSRTTAWAEPGYYHVTAAAMGSEPEDKQFELSPPAPVTITPSPTAEPRDKKKAREESPEASASADEQSED